MFRHGGSFVRPSGLSGLGGGETDPLIPWLGIYIFFFIEPVNSGIRVVSFFFNYVFILWFSNNYYFWKSAPEDFPIVNTENYKILETFQS